MFACTHTHTCQSFETEVDTDGDGVGDFLDTDSDYDFVPDHIEGAFDSDSDGIPDFRDSDSDNDGIPDIVEGLLDTGMCECLCVRMYMCMVKSIRGIQPQTGELAKNWLRFSFCLSIAICPCVRVLGAF